MSFSSEESLTIEIEESMFEIKQQRAREIEDFEIRGNFVCIGDEKFSINPEKDGNFTVSQFISPSKRKSLFGTVWCKLFRKGNKIKEIVRDLFSDYYLSTNKLGVGETTNTKFATTDEIVSDVLERIFYLENGCSFLQVCDLKRWIDEKYLECCLICGRKTGHTICGGEICINNFIENPVYRDFDGIDKNVFYLLHGLVKEWLLSSRKEYLFCLFPEIYNDKSPIEKHNLFLNDMMDLDLSQNYSLFTEKQKYLIWWIYSAPQCYAQISSEIVSFSDKPVFTYTIKRRDDPKITDFQIAYHGSAGENWLSIFANGLLSLSGTDHQLNGKMYGSGTYLAKDISTSKAYARGEIRLVAECAIPKRYSSNPYFVIKDPRDIQMLKLFVV